MKKPQFSSQIELEPELPSQKKLRDKALLESYPELPASTLKPILKDLYAQGESIKDRLFVNLFSSPVESTNNPASFPMGELIRFQDKSLLINKPADLESVSKQSLETRIDQFEEFYDSVRHDPVLLDIFYQRDKESFAQKIEDHFFNYYKLFFLRHENLMATGFAKEYARFYKVAQEDKMLSEGAKAVFQNTLGVLRYLHGQEAAARGEIKSLLKKNPVKDLSHYLYYNLAQFQEEPQRSRSLNKALRLQPGFHLAQESLLD